MRGHGDAGTRRRGDAGTRGCGDAGTPGHGDAETWGHGDAGTRRRGDAGTRGCGDAGGERGMDERERGRGSERAKGRAGERARIRPLTHSPFLKKSAPLTRRACGGTSTLDLRGHFQVVTWWPVQARLRESRESHRLEMWCCECSDKLDPE